MQYKWKLLRNNKILISIIYYSLSIALRTNILDLISNNAIEKEDAYYTINLTLFKNRIKYTRIYSLYIKK
jgi:hypothetical protein